MRSLGIDLAAQPAKTAICVVTWDADAAHVELPAAGAGDEALLTAMATADWVGIDAPFGWPTCFADAVAAYGRSGQWPEDARSTDLRLRVTDAFVSKSVLAGSGASLIPLSVSSDRIAVCAWRCAALLTGHHRRAGTQLDRVGSPRAPGGVVEVYPAAALAMWNLPFRGYKSVRAATADAARTRRETIVEGLTDGAAGELVVSEEVRNACVASDHCLDALIAALVAAAAASGDTIQPGVDERDAAELEGWIHVPSSTWLSSLGSSRRRTDTR